MMKLSVITIHYIYNYGSALQSYALCKFLGNYQYDVELIDYRPNYERGIIRKLKTLMVKIIFMPQYVLRAKRYSEFLRNNVKMSEKRYVFLSQLREDPPAADIYISGSDQLWNNYFPCGRDEAYKLCFVRSGIKMSYATSLGRNDFTKADLVELAERIKSYQFISVREKSGQAQLRSVGLEGVEHVCDPVLLLEKEDYTTLAVAPKYEKYLLLYTVHRDSEIFAVANHIAKEKGLKTVLIGDLGILGKCDAIFKSAGPSDFIGLIMNAGYIVTNSFHCLAFSLMFNKNFKVVMPHVNASRVENILQVAGLEQQMITSKEDPVDLEPIDYTMVNKQLSLYVKHSRDILLSKVREFAKENPEGD